MSRRIFSQLLQFILMFSLLSITSSDIVMAQILKSGISTDDTNAGGIISKKEAVTGPTFIIRIVPVNSSNIKASFYFENIESKEKITLQINDLGIDRLPFYVPKGYKLYSADDGGYYWNGVAYPKDR